MLYDSDVAETYGRVVCEAQRCGCIPIVSNRGGFVEQIDNGVDGFLCDGVESFRAVLKEVAEPGVRRIMSEKAVISGDSRGKLSIWREKFLNYVRATVCEDGG